MRREQSFESAIDVIDHLLIGAADLDLGISWLKKQTGIEPVLGGVHPGGGTRNALISLGSSRYLEIIAPDPQQSSYNFHIDLRQLKAPCVLTWAAISRDIEGLSMRLRNMEKDVSGPRSGSRLNLQGELLKWKTLVLPNQIRGAGIEPIPFFIQWDQDSLHPSKTSPVGCVLQSLTFEHPNPDELHQQFNDVEITAEIIKAPNVRIVAALNSPNGLLQLS